MNIDQVITKLAAKRDEKIAAANAEYERTAAAVEQVRELLGEPVKHGRKLGGKNRTPGQTAAAREWLAKQTGEFTTRDIAAGLPSIDGGIVHFAIKRLMAEGKMQRVAKGHRNTPGIYRVIVNNGQHAEAEAVTA